MSLAGIGGTLLPRRYLADGLPAAWVRRSPALERDRRRWLRWWTTVERSCGPASGLRALFDEVASPAFGMLGFRARHVDFESGHARGWLEARAGGPVGFMLLPWAEQPSVLWRDVAHLALDIGAAWCFVLAPPFLSLISATLHASRRAIDFTLPDVLADPESFLRFVLVAHASSFAPTPTPQSPRLETLMADAARFQDRVRSDLQRGVLESLAALSSIVPGHRRTKPHAGTSATGRAESSSPGDEALTVVYRVLFLLFAESRQLVPVDHPVYSPAYAVGSLCRDAIAGNDRGLWEGLAAITRLSRAGCTTDDLIVRPFNGRLFARASAPSLEPRPRERRRLGADGRDRAMRAVLTALGSRAGRGGREEISYADLGVEQLGAVYEHVLDLDLDLDLRPAAAGLEGDATSRTGSAGREREGARRHSDRRKRSGTFYTPQALAEFVVRRTLEPLVRSTTADGILALRVVDPAMGSGAFLVAACQYLAAAYERALVEEGRAAPGDLTPDERANIRRLMAERCLAGVDRNPTAVQLARLSLWLTSLARGKPLGFLDHRLRTGDSLIGASPDDLRRVAQPGRAARDLPLPLLEAASVDHAMRQIVGPLAELAKRDESVDVVRTKEAIWRRLQAEASPLDRWRRAAAVWCARWFWPSGHGGPPSPAETRALIDSALSDDRTLPLPQRRDRFLAISAAAADHRFFHWPLEFADVFYDERGSPRSNPGFDAVIGNPPWEMVRKDARDAGEDRGDLVRFVRECGVYPSCGRGHLNLYQPFTERALTLARRGGRVGLILPWGFAADDGAAPLRRRLFEDSAVDTVVGLDNARGIFPVHRGVRFLVLTTTRGGPTGEIRARFGVTSGDELARLPDRDTARDAEPYPVRLSPPALKRMTGPALRIPDCRRAGDARLLAQLADRFPSIGSAAGWDARFGRELNATDDRPSFGRGGLPVIEGKHLRAFHVEASDVVHRIAPEDASRLLPDGRFRRPRLGYRDVSAVANRMTLIAAIVPADMVTTHTIFCLRTAMPMERQQALCALMNSYVMNAMVRLLMGSHLTTALVEQLPAPPWSGSRDDRHLARIAAGAHRAAPHRTALLQAVAARLFGVSAHDFRELLDGFPLVPLRERQQAARARERLGR